MNLFCSGFSRFVFLNIISFEKTTFFQPLFFFPAQMANSKGLRVGRLVVIVQVVEQLWIKLVKAVVRSVLVVKPPMIKKVFVKIVVAASIETMVVLITFANLARLGNTKIQTTNSLVKCVFWAKSNPVLPKRLVPIVSVVNIKTNKTRPFAKIVHRGNTKIK